MSAKISYLTAAKSGDSGEDLDISKINISDDSIVDKDVFKTYLDNFDSVITYSNNIFQVTFNDKENKEENKNYKEKNKDEGKWIEVGVNKEEKKNKQSEPKIDINEVKKVIEDNIKSNDNKKTFDKIDLENYIFDNMFEKIATTLFPEEETFKGLDILKAADHSYNLNKDSFGVSIPYSFFDNWYNKVKEAGFKDDILIDNNHTEPWTANPHECTRRFFTKISKETNLLDGLKFKVERIQEERKCLFYKENGENARAIVVKFTFI